VPGVGVDLRGVADAPLVDDEPWVAPEAHELGLQLPGVAGVGQGGDPADGGEQGSVSGLAGAIASPMLGPAS